MQDGIVGEKTLLALKAAQKRTAIEEVVVKTAINYEGLVINTDCQMPDNQYIKRVSEKSQIFLHFTAGGPSAKNTIDYWNGGEVQVATTYVIDRNTGTPFQSFHPDYWAYHLGIKGTNGKLDKASIGIEICSYGPLVKKGNDFFAWPNNYSTKKVNPENVITLDKPFRGSLYYQKFTDEQIDNLEKLLIFLIKKYNIKIQEEFNEEWLEYNQELINKCLPGIWSHSNVRKDKSDIYPDPRMFDMLNRLAKQFN